jgi:hypothetical protein
MTDTQSRIIFISRLHDCATTKDNKDQEDNMFETMHYDIHLEREREMFNAADTSRQIRLLRRRRGQLRSGNPFFRDRWSSIHRLVKQLGRSVDSVVSPNRHGLPHS